MDYKSVLENVPFYKLERGTLPTEDMYTDVFNFDRLAFCFYGYEDDFEIYCKLRHRFKYYSEIYNEYGDSNMHSNTSEVILTFKANCDDRIEFDEIYDPTFQEIHDFIKELSAIFKVIYLFISVDNKAVGYIDSGECYEYEAVKR
ncbi:hypothetical protein ACOT7R_16435 [Clostridium perfringens]|uniref:hypothetical protein n=1 Tax=Clostridium perfringens TaxID=1502 RepID=UPI003BA9D785